MERQRRIHQRKDRTTLFIVTDEYLQRSPAEERLCDERGYSRFRLPEAADPAPRKTVGDAG
jgi:hypothetical protein